jgi:hypothetical protein
VYPGEATNTGLIMSLTHTGFFDFLLLTFPFFRLLLTSSRNNFTQRRHGAKYSQRFGEDCVSLSDANKEYILIFADINFLTLYKNETLWPIPNKHPA